MSTVVLKLFAGQDTGWTDGWMDRQTKQRLYASTFGEHNKTFYLTHIISEEKIHTVCW